VTRFLRTQSEIESAFQKWRVEVAQRNVIDEDLRGERILPIRDPSGKSESPAGTCFWILRRECCVLA
jgi:hypothetical protein